MRWLRGCLYWLVTRSRIAWLVGTLSGRTVFDRHGRILTPDNCTPCTRSGIIFGAYEYSEKYLVRKWLPRDTDVIELGSSIGIVSREILHRIDKSNRLVAVEAVPALAALARANIGRLHQPKRWQILSAAIAYHCSEASFTAGPEHVAGRVVADNNRRGEGTITVRTTTLSRILTEFGVSTYSLVMDIEGAEHEVISHDRAALDGCRCLISELHGSEEDKDRFCRALNDIGMTLVERKHSVVAFLRS